MRSYKPERSHFIPEGAEPHADPESTAIAYLYTSGRGAPGAVMFSGKRQRPDSHYTYQSEARRAQAVEQHREGVRRNERYMADRKAATAAARKDAASLDFSGKDYLSAPEVAALCRACLKEAFPGQKFSVTSKGSLRVCWTDGPSREDVERIADTFAGSYFDGMIDYKGSIYHSIDGRRVRLSNDFVFCTRTLTAEALEAGRVAYESDNPERAGAVEVVPPASEGGGWRVQTAPDHGHVIDRHGDGELQGPDGRFVRAALALERWHDVARPIAPKPSPTFQRIAVTGTDGYGNTALPAADGGETGRGYPQPKEREPDPAAVAAAEQLRQFLATWQPKGMAH